MSPEATWLDNLAPIAGDVEKYAVEEYAAGWRMSSWYWSFFRIPRVKLEYWKWLNWGRVGSTLSEFETLNENVERVIGGHPAGLQQRDRWLGPYFSSPDSGRMWLRWPRVPHDHRVSQTVPQERDCWPSFMKSATSLVSSCPLPCCSNGMLVPPCWHTLILNSEK